MKELRNYQRLALCHVQQRLEEGYHRLYVSLPTGTGKSVLLAALATHAREQGRVLVLVHLQDLVLQLTRELTQEGHDVGLLMQGYQQIDQSVVVATPQSLLAMLPAFLEASPVPVNTTLIDESHHAVPGSAYEQILTAL
ncbi:MAG TPA: DEAD/DEAH box helicase family protein [Ktedonobacteraceae bacterium]|nr:DEAD/DEAH box helicase family protein [Ktedonobacteraceae bacterium]